MSDEKYYKGLPVAKRRKIDKQLASLQINTETQIPLKYRVLESELPDSLKVRALEHCKNISEGDDNEYSQRWLNYVLNLPWNNKTPRKIYNVKIDYSRFSEQQLDFLDSVK